MLSKWVSLAVNRCDAIELSLTNDLNVTVYQQSDAEWIMATSDVAKGYGVATNTIRSTKERFGNDFQEGVHFKSTVAICDGGSVTRSTMRTKAGVVRLGFHVRSNRAKQFRDWAENVILHTIAPRIEAPVVSLPKAVRRQHNRLSKDRLVEILAVVALVDNKEVRKALVTKLMPDMDLPGIQLQLPLDGGKGGAV